ncbi:tetratricopeptide repeat protein [uncultured Chryseobacterium sp.]|uniref:tetratricopeptide repeat protein n=1 Tax=uncultured Chryseobacterium sp. TaxID=259322 RepID=UPI0025D23980|nr:tetratricopeptide repeat protein [uncultured Chryseobacterium sp.]
MIKHFLLTLTSSFFLNSCAKPSEHQEKVSDPLDHKSISKTQNSDKNDQTPNVTIEGDDLIVVYKNKKTVYKNLIVNEMSVSTELIQNSDNGFSLLYDQNASSTKIKEKYDFIYSDTGIFLVDKEIIKFGQDGLMINRLYVHNFNLSNKTFEDLQSLGAELPDHFEQGCSSMSIYDSENVPFATQNFRDSTEDLFISYPDVKDGDIKISNVESANNQAFNLEKIGANQQSKILLEQIIRQFPERIVAYLNLADVLWKIQDHDQAKIHYAKYLSLMKSQNKNLSKVPQRVYDRIK